MVLAAEQQEKIVRIRANLTKLTDELEKITMPGVVLSPTLDQDIANINSEIISYSNHPGMTRVQYVTIVQPLKDQRTALINQNIIIKEQNNALQAAAQQQTQTDRAVIQQKIDTAETELIDYVTPIDLKEVIIVPK